MTKVVNIYKEDYDVYIGRKGKGQDGYFGNPFPLKEGEERGSTLEKYREYFYDRLKADKEFRTKIEGLKGKRLGCFCPSSETCHGGIIKEYLDSMSSILDEIKIDFYPGKIWLTQKLGQISLRQFIESHKNPKPEIKEIFNKIAEAEKKEDWETKGKLKQENLFYFTPCVKLDGKGRSYENILGFNSLAVWDFDHIPIDADEFRDKLFEKYKCIVCCYKSPSSNGVKALVKIPRVKTTEEFKSYFHAMSYEMEHVKSFDSSGQNSNLPLFLSWDENIRWREDPETWTQRGGKYDEFEPYTGDFEEIENVTDEDKKTALKIVYNQVKKADEEGVGHPNVLTAGLLGGGYCSTGYFTYDEIENYLFKWIDDSPYLSTKADTYKKTAVTMLQKGTQSPLYLKKHQDKKPKEIAEKEQNRQKRTRKYYLLNNLTTFNIEKSKDIRIFGKNRIKIKEL